MQQEVLAMGAVVIRARNLFDGLGATLADPVVVIKDSRIEGVYQGEAPGEPDVLPLDFPGATIMPGLINCHNHLNLPGDGTPFEQVVRYSDNVLGMLSERNAGTALRSGVTTLRDCGGRGATTFDLRRAVQAGWIEGPRLVLCGQPITITGGHCWYLGGEADGAEGLREEPGRALNAYHPGLRDVGRCCGLWSRREDRCCPAGAPGRYPGRGR